LAGGSTPSAKRPLDQSSEHMSSQATTLGGKRGMAGKVFSHFDAKQIERDQEIRTAGFSDWRGCLGSQ